MVHHALKCILRQTLTCRPDQLVSKTPNELKAIKDFIQQHGQVCGQDNFGVIAEEYETWRTQKNLFMQFEI